MISGIGVFRIQLKGRKLDFPVARALFAMVANRVCAPCSKLYCYEQWLREDVRIAGTDTLLTFPISEVGFCSCGFLGHPL